MNVIDLVQKLQHEDPEAEVVFLVANGDPTHRDQNGDYRPETVETGDGHEGNEVWIY
jgi:hypothetical protein